jgi:hypothetical protein
MKSIAKIASARERGKSGHVTLERFGAGSMPSALRSSQTVDGRCYPDAEDSEFAVAAAVAPRRVLPRQPQEKAADRSDRARTPRPAVGTRASVSTPDQVTVPAQGRIRGDQQPNLTRHLPRQP